MSEHKISPSLEMAREKLVARKIELEESLAQSAQEKFSDDQVQDPGDQALTSTMESLRTSLQDSQLEDYNRVIQALEMIEQGTYGICVDCNKPIAERRLISFPNATRCIACQERFEENNVDQI